MTLSVMTFSIRILSIAFCLYGSGVIGFAADGQQGADKPAAAQNQVTLQFAQRKWVGDFDGMVKRRVVRALVVHSRTQYFVDRGATHGIAYEALTAFEQEINRGRTPAAKIHVLAMPVARDQLIAGLVEGRGDLAVAGLTITPNRDAQVDFSMPTNTRPLSEIVVTGPRSAPVRSVADLSGRKVFTRRSSSYWEHLEALNERFRSEGKPPVTLKAAPENLEDEDLLELLNAGSFDVAVVDDYVAQLWSKVLPNIRPQADVAVHTGGELAWAFRANSPVLKTAVDAFARTHRQGTAFGNTVIKRYLGSTRFIRDATSKAELEKFQRVVDLFRRYGNQYRIDFLLMLAQGYQESRLDHAARSSVGAIGVMQVLLATGRDMKVGDVKQLDANVHAGIKYIRFMIDTFFQNEPMDDLNKALFAFAAYNAGPGRIRQLRREAAARGLDPNKWFNNVEVVAAQRVGAEPVTYVSNIFKYYVTYRLVTEDEKPTHVQLHH